MKCPVVQTSLTIMRIYCYIICDQLYTQIEK